MKKLLLCAVIGACSVNAMAQSLTTVPTVRIWEHHSSAINGGKGFGGGANGSMAGYDFVNHTHSNSFDPVTMDTLPAAQLVNLDLVEHNSKYGNNGPFGFTSGTSSIWGGDIKGNNLTKYFPAPASFIYDTITNVASIRNAYDSMMASNSVAAVVSGAVYLVRVRNTNMYVAMKVTNVVNLPANHSGSDTASVYFDFVYKYGTYQTPNSIANVGTTESDLKIFPVPNNGTFTVSGTVNCDCNTASISVLDLSGRIVHTEQASVKSNALNTEIALPASLPSGFYHLRVVTEKDVEVVRFVKQ